MHLLGLIERLPGSRYVSMTESLPMLRAVKDADELGRLSSAAESADAVYYDILQVPFAGRKESEIGADLAELLRTYGHARLREHAHATDQPLTDLARRLVTRDAGAEVLGPTGH
jgi:D-alanyl-D-alanine dipeptidase